jgi:two-component system uhpT operon response regulator UhpA
MSITVFLIDEYASILSPTRSLLETQRDFIVIGEASDRPSAVSAVARCHPDVVVLNLTLPIQGSLEAVQHIRALCPSTQVILLALFLRNEDVGQAIGVGVQGFVSYEAITSELTTAIRTVVVGEGYLSRNLAEYEVALPLLKLAPQNRLAFGLPSSAPHPVAPLLGPSAD